MPTYLLQTPQGHGDAKLQLVQAKNSLFPNWARKRAFSCSDFAGSLELTTQVQSAG